LSAVLKTRWGLYVQADASITENHSLTEAARWSPKGVICLVSALLFHGLTSENSAEVWIAIPRGARPPKSTTPTLRVSTLLGEIMTEEIKPHRSVATLGKLLLFVLVISCPRIVA